MTTLSVQRGRPPHKSSAILQELRRRIVCGQIAPGARLPGRFELSEAFDASTATVQHAINNLLRDGFIDVLEGVGTFVADHPPHLCTYGLVFPRFGFETRFFRALRRAAKIVFDPDSRRLRLYESEMNNPTDPENIQLIDDVVNHRVAGVILVWPDVGLLDTPLYAPDCGVPRVVIGSSASDPRLPTLGIDMLDFHERAVDRLIALGSRKIAHIGIGDNHRESDYLTLVLQRRGLEHQPYWDQRSGVTYFAAARRAAHVLMSLPPADRPDGLVISDDNLVEPAQAGLADAGTRVPADLRVVAHCNWPEPPAAIFPIVRLGFDAVAAMRTCTRLIDQMRSGQNPSEGVIRIEPQFEEELSTASSAVAERGIVTSSE